jgi:hypothetical protein
VVDTDSVGSDARSGESLALDGGVLFVGGASGVSDEKRRLPPALCLWWPHGGQDGKSGVLIVGTGDAAIGSYGIFRANRTSIAGEWMASGQGLGGRSAGRRM